MWMWLIGSLFWLAMILFIVKFFMYIDRKIDVSEKEKNGQR